MVAPGTVLDGRYEVLRELGSGGMARVYLARHVVLGSLHAVKLLLPEMAARAEVRDRFLVEGRIQSQLRHPNIVRVTEIIQGEALAGLVLEYVQGESLADWMATRLPVPVAEAVAMLLPVIEALAGAHAKGIVHRDLKPENILVTAGATGPVPMLLDFGIAKPTDTSDIGAQRHFATIAGMALGTPMYMSPEQIRAPQSVDARSDIYAIGAILYELLSGKTVVEDGEATAVMARVVLGERRPILQIAPELPAAVAAVVERSLAHEANQRFSGCDELRTALIGALAPPASRPAAAPKPPPRVPVPTGSTSPTSPARKTATGASVATPLLVGAALVVGAFVVLAVLALGVLPRLLSGTDVAPAAVVVTPIAAPIAATPPLPAPTPTPAPIIVAAPPPVVTIPRPEPKPFAPVTTSSSSGLSFACGDAALAKLDGATLELRRNEVFARHGHVFKRADLRTYFEAQPWYAPDASFKDSSINSTERDCVARIKARERATSK